MKPDVVAMVVGGALGGVAAVVAVGWWICPVAELLVVHVVKRHYKTLISTIDASYEYTMLTL
jgi:hypothetical protein